MPTAYRSITTRYVRETLALGSTLALAFGLLEAFVGNAGPSPALRLGIGFFTMLCLGACLSLHAHFVLIRPLQKLSRGLRDLNSQPLTSADFVMSANGRLANEFDEIDREFHELIAKLHQRHQEGIRTKNKPSQATSRFHDHQGEGLGEMAASIAHDINNPLAILAGRLEQLRELMLLPDASSKIDTVILSMEKTIFRIQDVVAEIEVIASNASPGEIRKVNNT